MDKLSGVSAVLQWLMLYKGFNDINEINANEPTGGWKSHVDISEKYVDKLVSQLGNYHPGVPFELCEPGNSTDTRFFEEIYKVMHPHVSDLAYAIVEDDNNFPEGEAYEEMKKSFCDAARRDCMEAARVVHPDSKCKHMWDIKYVGLDLFDSSSNDDHTDDMYSGSDMDDDDGELVL